MKAFLPVLLILTLALGCPQAALAHSVETDYTVSDRFDRLDLQAKFSTGEPFQDAPVKIYAPGNLEEPWLEGTTDLEGQFAFQPEPSIQGEWTLQVGQFDHADILQIPVDALGIDAGLISRAAPAQHVAHAAPARGTWKWRLVTAGLLVAAGLGLFTNEMAAGLRSTRDRLRH